MARPSLKSTLIPVALLISVDLYGLAFAEPADFQGVWKLDVASSDPLEPQLKRLRHARTSGGAHESRPNKSTGSGSGSMGDRMESSYWAFVKNAREAKALDTPVRLGASHAILAAERLGIDWDGSKFSVNYDEKVKRIISPNPNGRIFTAKGEELVTDDLGHGLSYWQDDQLIVETTTHGRARIIERLALSTDKTHLQIKITMDKPGWAKPLDIVRVFNAVR